MQLTKLSIDSFLQVRAMDLELASSSTVHIICGHNESGKSSVHEAIRFAMLGETERVSYKKDYKRMIRAGSKSGSVRLDYVDGDGNHDFIQRDVSTGNVEEGFTGDPDFAVAEVMDATKYPYYDAKHQRKMLSQLLNIKIDAKEVSAALARAKIDDAYIEQIKPMLRAGFDAAHKEAKAKQSEHRAKWEQLTGEKWGAQKAVDWKPEQRLVGKGMMEAKKREVEKYKSAHEKALEKVGAAKSYSGGVSCPCPACGVHLTFTGQKLILHSEQASPDENREGNALRKEADNLGGLYEQEMKDLQRMEADLDFNQRMDQIQKDAQDLHKHVLGWMNAADELAPDGIPGQIIADKLKPINERLRNTAMLSGWDQVVITPVMEMMIGALPYSLCSESAQWRAQAAIAEAVSYVGEIGIFCLDRFDVLDLPNRGKLLKWIHSVATDHKTILLFGTLKEAPKKLPSSMSVHWLEQGQDTSAPPL